MSVSDERKPVTPNRQAVASLILGLLSVVLALFNFVPGWLSALGCVGVVAALLAYVAGIQGLRAVGAGDKRARNLALGGMVAAGLGLVLFLVVMGAAVLDARDAVEAAQTPQIFQGADYTLIYPGAWQTFEVDSEPFCRQPEVRCPLAIHHPSGDGTSLNLVHLDLGEALPIQEVDQMVWAQFVASTPDLTLASRETTRVGGQPAIRRVFTAPSPNASDGRAHILQFYVVKGTTFYQFTGWTPDAEALQQHRAELEAIVQSVRWSD